MEFILIPAFILFFIYFMMDSKLNLVRDARGHHRGCLNQRYALISDMMTIVKIHVPEFGLMLERLIELRLSSADKVEENVSDEIKQELFQTLFDLIKTKDFYNSYDSSVRKEFEEKLCLAEENIQASHKFYICALKDYNRFITAGPVSVLSNFFGHKKQAIYNYPETFSDNEKSEVSILEGLKLKVS